MAKKKYQANQVKNIRIYILLIKGSEGYEMKQEDINVGSQTIEYNYIRQVCQQFLREQLVGYQTNLYFVDSANFHNNVLVAPGFSIPIQYIIEKLEGNLMFVIKSAIDELKQTFIAEIDNLKSQIELLKLQIQVLKKPLSLQLLRKNSIAPSPLMLQAHSYLSKNYSQVENYDEVQLDIAILFSEPLYDEERKKITSPAVDFRSQITRLHGALQNSFKPSIVMRCQIATFESLQTTIKYSKPKIMHIICHGNNEGNLEFQDDSRNTLGLLQLLKPTDLKNLLKSQKQDIPELVFINSCHSEKVGRAFFQLGVPNVVMINSEDLISDQAAQIFSQNFYRKIFKGATISEAFDTSKSRVEQKYVGQCCCNHSLALQPHRENCEWYRMFKNQPYQSHRNYHIPKCDCEERNKNIHSFKCQWATKTLFQINRDFRIQQQKSDGTKQFRFPSHISEFPPYVDKLNKTLTICCCPPLQGKPHSESRKFIILSQDKEKVLMPVIHNREHPEIIDLTSAQLLQAHEKSKAIFGRQRQLFEFLKNVQDTNFVYVYGRTGVGLTTFTIKASTYMMERRVFEFFFFFDLYDIKDVTVFRYKFNEITKFQYNGSSIIDYGIKNKKMLLLFDNCDSFIDQDLEKFYQQIQNLLRQFPKCKIIITFKQEMRRNFDQKKINQTNLGYQLHPFEDRPATFFLHGKMRYKADMSVGLKQLAKLVKKYEVLKIPKVIQSLCQSIPITKKNVTLQQIEKSVEQIKLSDTNLLTKSVLDQLKEINPQAYEFLVFCSLFSDGVTFEDINMFSCYFKPGMSVELPVRKNWQEHYLLLLEKQPVSEVTSSSSLPKLQTSVSYSQQANVHPQQRKLEMKKRESEQIPFPIINKEQKGQFDKLNKINSESYFIDRNGPGKFIVKRFIRDYLWKSHLNQTTNQTKFLFVAYFSVILQMLFETLKAENYIHQQLTTYSAISSAGVFKFRTTLKDIYGQRNLTQSTRFAISFMSDLNDIFINNQQLLEKMKKTDHSTFIMNHRQDFLKFYDTRWPDVHEHLVKRGKSEEKIFVILLQNLMIYIPTAFKIANAQQSLLRYVIKRSEKELIKLRRYSEMQRNLKLLLKLYMIEVGISLENNSGQLKEIFNKGFKQIKDCNVQLAKRGIRSLEISDIQIVMQMEQFGCDLLLDDANLKMLNINDFQHIINKKAQFLKVNKQYPLIEPLIRAKLGYMICCLFLKFMLNNKPELTMALKPYSQSVENKNAGDIFGILNICENSIKIFESKACIKLKVRALLTSIQLFWAYNQKMKGKNKEIDTEEMEKWRQRLVLCEKEYLNDKNKLKGFTEFDDKIKELNQKIKQRLWISASRRLIFMKAYPLCSKQQPILKNLIRKKNNFRQQIEKILIKAGREDQDRPEKRVQQSPSTRQLSPYSNHQERRHSLDISTKYQILTAGKISEEAKAKCSIMFINVDVKTMAGKVFLICENDVMQEELVQLNQQLSLNLNMDNILIVVLTGVNTRKAMSKINQLNKNPPIIISLQSEPFESHDEIDSIHDFDSQLIRQVIKRQNEIKQAELMYTKSFIQLVTSLQISKKQDIKYIHEKSCSKMVERVKNCHVKAYIELGKCNDSVCLKFNPGVYRDLSPGYEGNHNIDTRLNDSAVSIRRWKKMIQFFKFLNLKKSKKQTQSINEETRRKNLFGSGSGYSKDQTQFLVELPGIYINIYGQNGCGKTYFIKEIAKILIQRQFYDFGVFLFEGKKIQKQFSGDFQAYIKKQASLGKMPVIDDFDRLLSDKTILIVDDFHLIRSRINARMKIFLDKVITKKVNLVLVSLIELKLDYLPVMKKIKLQSLDSLETQVLAFNIININSEQQLMLYSKLKQKAKKQSRSPSVKQIESIDRNAKNLKKKGYTQKIINGQQTSGEQIEVNNRMRKSFTSYQKQ